jgi:hypothetical protein
MVHQHEAVLKVLNEGVVNQQTQKDRESRYLMADKGI